jgi:hypothetical protein
MVANPEIRPDGASLLAEIALSPPRPQVADVCRVGVVVWGDLRQADAEAGPLLGHHNGVLRVAWLVAHRAGEAGLDLGGVDHIAHVGDVLSALVVHTSDAVMEEEHGEGAPILRCDVANVEQHAVDDAPGLHHELPACPLQLFGRGTLAEDVPEHKTGEGGKDNDAGAD